MRKVFLSFGHGGSDSGAVGNGFKEKDLNLSIGLSCLYELDRHGVDVKTSRLGDENDPVEDEVQECNSYNPEVAVSIHVNAGGGDGCEAWYHHGGGLGKTLAENILSEVVKIGQNSRGAKTRKGSDGRDYYYFIRETVAHAVIVECAFIDNAEDIKILNTEEKCQRMGISIAKGILSTLGITWKEPAPSKPTEKIYTVNVSDLKKEGYTKIVLEV